jgi:hypothetical protein
MLHRQGKNQQDGEHWGVLGFLATAGFPDTGRFTMVRVTHACSKPWFTASVCNSFEIVLSWQPSRNHVPIREVIQ